jgi:hypothetical protein
VKKPTRIYTTDEKLAAAFRHKQHLKILTVLSMLQSELCDDPLLRASLLSLFPKDLDVALEVQSLSHDLFVFCCC